MDIKKIAKEYLLEHGYESDLIDYMFNSENCIIEDSYSRMILLRDRLLVIDRASDTVVKDISFEDEMGEYGDGFSKIETDFLHAINLARNNEKELKGIVVDAFSEPFVLDIKLFDIVEKMKSRIKNSE